MKQFSANLAVSIASSLSLSLLLHGTAMAQESASAYPSKPVTVVMFTLPGGSTEFETRLYTEKMSKSWGKPIVFDYKAGAGGAIGAAFADLRLRY